MSTLLRASLGTVVAAGCLLTSPLRSQDFSDVAAATCDLRQTLRDLDKRLAKLEELVNQEAARNKKQRSSKKAAVVTTIRIDPTANLLEGQDAYRRGDVEESGHQYEKAIELYSKAIGLDPGNELAFLHRAKANLQIGRLDEALADVNRSVAIQPNNAEAYAFRGTVYTAIKSYQLALTDLQEAFHRDPNNADYLMLQGGVDEQLGSLKKAAEMYEWASKLKPDSPEVYLKRANVLRQLNAGTEAAEQCAVAIRLNPNSAEGYACRSESYVRLGLLPQALADLNEAVRLQPTLPKVSNLLSVVRDMLSVNDTVAKFAGAQNAKATEIARAPIEPIHQAPPPILAPPPAPQPVIPATAATPLVSRAPIAAPAATNVMNTVPAPDPAASRRLVRESRRSIETGSFQAALSTINHAIELDRTSALAYNTRGYVYLRLRQFDLAIRDFSKAIDLNSTYANAYMNRGAARRFTGDTRGGREDINKAAQLGYPVPAPSSEQ